MKFAYDLPGYVQGHRFSNDPLFYDSTSQRFYDLAGGDRFKQGVTKIVGTPVFNNRGINSRQGLYLDNTNQWQFPHACPWEGSMVIVGQFKSIVNQYIYPWLFAEDTGTITNNPLINTFEFGGSTYLRISGGSGQLQHQNTIPNDQIIVFALSRSQDDRTSRYSRDGVTIEAVGPYDPTLSYGTYIGMGGQPRVRLGALDGTNGTTTSTVGTCHVFEQHFFRGNILRDNQTETAEFMNTLKSYYGVV